MTEQSHQHAHGFKVFDLYDVSAIEIKDPALKPYINVNGKLKRRVFYLNRRNII